MQLEDPLPHINSDSQQFKPGRVAVDSLSALERVSTPRSFREFVIDLTSFIKEREIAGLFTATTPALLGGQSVTESHISRSEEHTSELQSHSFISYAVFCLNK